MPTTEPAPVPLSFERLPRLHLDHRTKQLQLWGHIFVVGTAAALTRRGLINQATRRPRARGGSCEGMAGAERVSMLKDRRLRVTLAPELAAARDREFRRFLTATLRCAAGD